MQNLEDVIERCGQAHGRSPLQSGDHDKVGRFRERASQDGSTAAESTFEVLVAFWPNILPDSLNNDEGSPALDFKYTLDEFTQLVLVLKAHGLAFVATLPSQTGIVASLNSQLDT
ncbi:hypothetical protein R3P38DRAFT_2805209 [Favolaschia claudopus]|uniref:Uncharacterized protein n=1 Tax=Favolaschia claudopus TaxID=2862362 RepID=A0AAV9ZP64_9AGAR